MGKGELHFVCDTLTPSCIDSAISKMHHTSRSDEDISSKGAQSVTTTARSPAAATAVTHSHVAAYSSPAAVPPVDTATPPASHSSVTVSDYLTRPDLLSPPPQSTPTLLQVLQQHHSPPRPQQIPQQYLPIQHNHHQTPQPIFHQQVVQQVIPDQLLQPHNQTVYQLVRPTSQIPGSKPQQPYYVLQSLLVNVDEQPKTVSYSQSQRSPVEQTQVSPHSHTQQLSPNLQPSHTQLSPTLHSSHTQQLSPTLHPRQINHHQQLSPTLRPSHTQQQLSPTLQQRLSPEPVHVGQGSFSPKPASVSSYSPKPGQSTVNRQSALLKQLLIQNLIKGKLPNSIQQQTISHHHHKTAPCETVPYREYPDHSESLVEISVPERSPPPYHSIQRVPEAPALGGEKPAKDGGGLSPIIVGTSEPSIVPEKMESRLGSFDTFINTCGDMPYSTDFIDASIYASSPNSLFMYDQEKMDMQSTLASTSMCTSVEVSGLTDDFELKTQYEISQDFSNNLPVCRTSVDQCGGGVSVDLGYDGGSGSVGVGGQMWGNAVIKPAKEDVMIKSESTCSTSTPTLAELNFDQDLLEDIETVISVDMNSGTSTSAPRDSHPTIKQEPDLYTTMATSQSTQHPPQHTAPVYTKLVNAQTVPVTKVEVKTEPQEVAKATVQNNNDEIAKILQSMSAKAWSKDNTTPKTLTPLTTIKQIDLSDARTLRHLLVDQRTAPPVKPQRKRTVSESATLKSATRKRGYPGGESMDKKWEEIKQFIHMETGGRGLEEETRSPVVAVRPPPVKRERRRNYSECSVATVTSNEDDESDSDRDLDDDSDSDLDDSHDISSLNPDESLIGEKDKQYFWQYNVQSKGPKGTRAHFDMEDDPHVLNDFEDPVFDPTNSNLAGVGISIKHGGKARKGDGNDIVPSPKKLCQIGLQLRKINRQINDFMPVSELPSGARNKTRKEKNKLASRACRLKKKAQHEANKVKLHGLETEHRQLLTVIRVMRQRLMERLRAGNVKQEEQATMTETLEGLMKQYLSTMIGGNTTDYVNKIVHKVEAGDLTGGINIKATAPRSYPKELHN